MRKTYCVAERGLAIVAVVAVASCERRARVCYAA
jgi:hypothetical protein